MSQALGIDKACSTLLTLPLMLIAVVCAELYFSLQFESLLLVRVASVIAAHLTHRWRLSVSSSSSSTLDPSLAVTCVVGVKPSSLFSLSYSSFTPLRPTAPPTSHTTLSLALQCSFPAGKPVLRATAMARAPMNRRVFSALVEHGRMLRAHQSSPPPLVPQSTGPQEYRWQGDCGALACTRLRRLQPRS